MARFERLFAFMIKPWVVITCLAVAFLSFLFLDRPIAECFHGVDSKTYRAILGGLTKLGSNFLYLGPLLVLALFFRYIYPNKNWETRVWFLWLCVLIPNMIGLVLKILIGRSRPSLLFDDHLYGFYWMKLQKSFWSLPSGHTTTVMGLLFGLCVLFPRYFLGFILIAFLVDFSRIILTEHYLSDVFVASYLALVEVGLLLVWLRCKKSDVYNRLKGCQ